MNHKSTIVLLISILVSFFLGALFGGSRVKPEVIERIDTLTVTKTITESLPTPEWRHLVRWSFISDTDTLTREKEVPYYIHDTIYVPISQSYYERLDGRLRLWISGYDTSLDRWELDEQTKYITEYRRKRFGFSVGAGACVIYTPFHETHIDAGLGLFAGFTYNF